MINFRTADNAKDFIIAKELFLEYASTLPVDLSFQNFNAELERISDEYGLPHGTLVIVSEQNETIGCFAIRKFEDSIGELKRMYLRENWQGKGIGMQMLNESILQAQRLGYHKMRLDTLPSMHAAIQLYVKTGFYEIEPYRFNPVKGTRYFEIKLQEV